MKDTLSANIFILLNFWVPLRTRDRLKFKILHDASACRSLKKIVKNREKKSSNRLELWRECQNLKKWNMNRVKSRRRSGLGPKRSPLKGKSPFKKRPISRLATNDHGGASAAEDRTESIPNPGPPAPANIRVAVRVRPENEREMVNACNR
jgi:hypothetical protein